MKIIQGRNWIVIARKQPFRYYHVPTGTDRFVSKDGGTVYTWVDGKLYQLENPDLRDDQAKFLLDSNNWELLNYPVANRYLQAKSSVHRSVQIYDTVSRKYLSLSDQAALVQKVYEQAQNLGIAWFSPEGITWIVPSDYYRSVWGYSALNPVTPSTPNPLDPALTPDQPETPVTDDLTDTTTKKFNPLVLIPLGLALFGGKGK